MSPIPAIIGGLPGGLKIARNIFGGPETSNLPHNETWSNAVSNDPAMLMRYRKYRALGLSDNEAFVLTVADFFTGDKYKNQRSARAKSLQLSGGAVPKSEGEKKDAIERVLDKSKSFLDGLFRRATSDSGAAAGKAAVDRARPWILGIAALGVLGFIFYRKGK